jgi:truncated hemoglobin YjbI
MQAEQTQSLYERLGGVYSIAVVVDDFIDRIMGDPRLNANPRVDEAHHRVSPQGVLGGGRPADLLGALNARDAPRAVHHR